MQIFIMYFFDIESRYDLSINSSGYVLIPSFVYAQHVMHARAVEFQTKMHVYLWNKITEILIIVGQLLDIIAGLLLD